MQPDQDGMPALGAVQMDGLSRGGRRPVLPSASCYRACSSTVIMSATRQMQFASRRGRRPTSGHIQGHSHCGRRARGIGQPLIKQDDEHSTGRVRLREDPPEAGSAICEIAEHLVDAVEHRAQVQSGSARCIMGAPYALLDGFPPAIADRLPYLQSCPSVAGGPVVAS